MARKIVNCAYCGTEFSIFASRRGQRHYCSNNCFARSTQNPLTRTIRTASGCLEWTGKRGHFGYGATQFRGRTISTHRKVWIQNFGEIPETLCVLHKCDNPPCINPEHLFLGTQGENARDRELKGRGGGAIRRANTTHCRNGHEYTAENTYYGANRKGAHPTKWCRRCIREKVRKYKQKMVAHIASVTGRAA